MAKKSVSEIETGAGYFQGFVTNLMDILRAKEIPFEVIYRLVKPEGRATLESMVETAHADWLAEQPKPQRNQKIAALEKKFSGEGSVSSLFDGRPWERHSSCVKIDETPGKRVFRLAEVPAEFLGKRISDCLDELAAHFDKTGERFAIETEAVDFADEDPEAQRKNYILALGSSAQHDDGYRYVTLLSEDGRGRVLDDCWVDRDLYANARLLLVRKASSAL